MKVMVKEVIHEQESGIKTVNINSFSFNFNHSMIITKLRKSSNQATIMVPKKVDMGCNGNIMPFNLFEKIIP